jgi:hypothetical protein
MPATYCKPSKTELAYAPGYLLLLLLLLALLLARACACIQHTAAPRFSHRYLRKHKDDKCKTVNMLQFSFLQSHA